MNKNTIKSLNLSDSSANNNKKSTVKNNTETIIDTNDSSKFSHKELILLYTIKKFFNNSKYLNKMISFITSESNISLRVLDWFVANYSKKNNIIYKIKVDNEIKHFNVYLEYKRQLDSHTKQNFDPFCRKKKILFHYTLNEKYHSIITTIGQLNFFKWAIKFKIIDYVEDNLQAIVYDMNTISKINKLKSKEISQNDKKLLNMSENERKLYDKQKILSSMSPDPDICIIDNAVKKITITAGMNDEKISSQSTTSSEKRRKKRQELSKSAYKDISKQNVSIVVSI
jgi:hypothetical protein